MKTITKSFLLAVTSSILSFSSIGQDIPMMLTAEGHLLVEVLLNDSIKGNFILDTGAGAVVLSQKMFDRIGSSTKPSGYFTGFRHDGDRIDGITYTVPKISLGNVTKNEMKVGVYPPLDNYGIDGLLSLKFFEETPFTIDFKNQKISILTRKGVEKLAKSNTSLPMKLYMHTDISLDVFIPICLNDSMVIDVEFDTGSGFGSFIINPHFISALTTDETTVTQSTYQAPISGRQLLDQNAVLSSVGVCANESSMSVKDATVIFREGLIYEGLIGSELFKQTAITIDIPGKRFIILD